MCVGVVQEDGYDDEDAERGQSQDAIRTAPCSF